MIFTTIAVTATLAPLIVALVCLYAHHKLNGGRHLLFWAIAHAALAVPFAIIGFTPWSAQPEWYLVLPATAGTLLAAVMLAAGIRVLIGHGDRIGVVMLVAIALILCTLGIRAATDLSYFGAIALLAGAAALYAGIILIRYRQGALYIATGILLMLRGCLSVLYAMQLLELNTGLEAILSTSTFANLLTGLGLMMIEFDNARHRERQAREDEHETRQFLETLLDAMPATMTYKDSNLRYRMINQRMRAMLTSYNIDPIGRTWTEIAGPDAAEAVEREDRRVIETGEPLHMEQGWLGPDGRPLVIWAMKVPLRDAAGEIQGVITCGIDITRLKNTESQLIEQREAAEAANRAKTAFLANMSHELRTPLNAIIGFAEMMAIGYLGDLTERQRDYASNIQQSGEHLLRLVSDILDLSRLETGRLELQIEDCDLEAVAATAMAMVEPQARQNGVTLHLQAGEKTVRADRRALTQILVNLLGNAVKFNRPGGSVTVSSVAEAHVVRISVTDTGIGMNEAESRAVMAPFHRIDAYRARNAGGAGLGLGICRSLIERHDGQLEIRSRPGHGTSVEVILPR